MESLPRDTVWHVMRMCALWAAISGSYNILHICIPLITRDISGEAAARWLGIFMSISAVCGAVFSALGGFFSDFFGRMALMRPWTLYFFVTVVAVVLAEAVSSVALLVFVCTAALSIPTTILLAYLSDFLRDAALVESYGYLSGSFGVANFTATILCGIVNGIFSRTASLLLALFLAAVALYISFCSPAPPSVQEALEERVEETRKRGKKDVVSREELYRALRLLLADRYLLLICIACSIVRMANMNDHLMLVYFISFRSPSGLSSISYILGLKALAMAFSQLIFLPFAVRHHCVFSAQVATLIAMSLGIMSFALCFTFTHFAISALLLGCSLMGPSVFNARISALTSGSGISGVTLGVVSTITNTVEIGVAIFFGNLLEWSTRTFKEPSFWSGIPFLVNGLTVALSLMLVLLAEWRYGKRHGPWGAENTSKMQPPLSIVEDEETDMSDVYMYKSAK